MSTTTPAPLRPASAAGWWADRRLLVDGGLALAVAVLLVLPFGDGATKSTLCALGMAGALALRRVQTDLALAIMVAAAAGLLVTSWGIPPVVVAVPIMVYSAASAASSATGQVALVAGWVGSVAGPGKWFGFSLSSNIPVAFVALLACGGFVTGAYLIGRRRLDSAAARRQQQAAAAERERLLAAEREQRVRSAAVQERQRIARELHDIVAHSLSVVVVQAEGGRALAARQPDRAAAVLGTIAETSREALEEMRQMVGLLRGEDDDAGGRAPAPGLGDLATLVARSGVDARLEERGPRPDVHPTLGLTVYRIVQESLTNVLKHAGPGARTTVRVAYAPEAIDVEVADDGRGELVDRSGVRATARRGHGLSGMAERVALHGGTLVAAPRSGPPGGFVVHAHLPLRRETP